MSRSVPGLALIPSMARPGDSEAHFNGPLGDAERSTDLLASAGLLAPSNGVAKGARRPLPANGFVGGKLIESRRLRAHSEKLAPFRLSVDD